MCWFLDHIIITRSVLNILTLGPTSGAVRHRWSFSISAKKFAIARRSRPSKAPTDNVRVKPQNTVNPATTTARVVGSKPYSTFFFTFLFFYFVCNKRTLYSIKCTIWLATIEVDLLVLFFSNYLSYYFGELVLNKVIPFCIWLFRPCHNTVYNCIYVGTCE